MDKNTTIHIKEYEIQKLIDEGYKKGEKDTLKKFGITAGTGK